MYSHRHAVHHEDTRAEWQGRLQTMVALPNKKHQQSAKSVFWMTQPDILQQELCHSGVRGQWPFATFHYMPGHDYSTEEIIEVGDMVSVSCQYCRAKKWKKETLSTCYSLGKVHLLQLQDPLSHSDTCSRVTPHNHDTSWRPSETTLDKWHHLEPTLSERVESCQGSRANLSSHRIAASNAEWGSTMSPDLLCGWPAQAGRALQIKLQ